MDQTGPTTPCSPGTRRVRLDSGEGEMILADTKGGWGGSDHSGACWGQEFTGVLGWFSQDLGQ